MIARPLVVVAVMTPTNHRTAHPWYAASVATTSRFMGIHGVGFNTASPSARARYGQVPVAFPSAARSWCHALPVHWETYLPAVKTCRSRRVSCTRGRCCSGWSPHRRGRRPFLFIPLSDDLGVVLRIVVDPVKGTGAGIPEVYDAMECVAGLLGTVLADGFVGN